MSKEPEVNVYQMERVRKSLSVLEEGQAATVQILKEIGETMKSFSEISLKQARQETRIEILQEDSKTFKQFIKNSHCSKHDAEINALNKSDDSQNKNTAVLIIGFITALASGFIGWLVKGG